jgi:hypothetical protein
MCDFSGKLIAWMDRELPATEDAEMVRHVGSCAECRERLGAYERASGAFDAYCEAVFTAHTQPKSPRWLPAAGLAAGIAAAAAIAALLMLPHQRVSQVPVRATPPASLPRISAQPPQAPLAPPPAAHAQRALSSARVTHPALAPVRRSLRQFASSTRAPSRTLDPEAASSPPPQSSQARTSGPFPDEPPIEIAIPADAMFPPGAVPPGTSFIADVTISADGSPQLVGLRPRLAGFERRAN